ncbi:hypothetical protein MN608_06708 [Microdochium nivale]|nr:hypothetical protein MN608_06708 [Microdochium nivale]
MVQHHQLYSTNEAAPSSTRRTELAGLIMWLPLPKKNNVSLAKGVYNHPVVILSPSPRSGGQVDFLVLTSLRETDLLHRYPHDKHKRLRYLPIHPAPRHPDNDALLRLSSRSTEELVKKTYVGTEKVHSARLKDLQEYWTQSWGQLYLSRASYGQLVDYVGYAPASNPAKHDAESIGIRGKPQLLHKTDLESTGNYPNEVGSTRQAQRATTCRETKVTTEPPGRQHQGSKMQSGHGHGNGRCPQGSPPAPPTPPSTGPCRVVGWQTWISLLLCYAVLVAYAMLVFVIAYMAWLLLAMVLQTVMQHRGWGCGGRLLSSTLSAEEEWLVGFLRRRLTLSTWLKTKAPVWAIAVFVYCALLVELYRKYS